MRYIVVIVPALVLFFSLAATPTVEGQIPTPADFVACNREAPQAARAGTVSPIKADHARADHARADHARADGERAGAVLTKATDVRGKVIESPDPQIHGME
ncbi:MAG TPA: hypothetical protein VML54_04525, partial [Candidatus Limnocylindrales bacterium]|nr:hypothetical protein [Candidatus Limnocylindrales bacterium]